VTQLASVTTTKTATHTSTWPKSGGEAAMPRSIACLIASGPAMEVAVARSIMASAAADRRRYGQL
jgi:hypothetical protein